LLETAIDLDVKLYACKMSMDVMEIGKEDLIDQVSGLMGGAGYIKEASESSVTLFVRSAKGIIGRPLSFPQTLLARIPGDWASAPNCTGMFELAGFFV
jgi:hypothetical protein